MVSRTINKHTTRQAGFIIIQHITKHTIVLKQLEYANGQDASIQGEINFGNCSVQELDLIYQLA